MTNKIKFAVPVLALGLLLSSGIAFAQNTRDEVRLINGYGQIVGALAASPGMKQTSYVAIAYASLKNVLILSIPF